MRKHETTRPGRALAAAAALLALLAAGCMTRGGQRVDVVRGGVVVGGGTRGWATKKVVEKKEPETLMAQDGSVCRVAPDRYKQTRVGTVIRCDWQ